MRGGILYAMAKQPRPGQVKTRLCPPLTALQACCLAGAFAADTLANMAALEGLETRLALAEDLSGRQPDATQLPAQPVSLLRELAARLGVAVEDQGDGDLGTRMARLLERGLGAGLPTILVGTDSPDLPRGTISAALEALARVDVAIAPAADGGYVLVAARRRIAELFDIDAPWGSERVFAATCESLRRVDCAFEVLGGWEDVDDAAALGRLAIRLGDGGQGAPVTARLLDEWRREGVRF